MVRKVIIAWDDGEWMIWVKGFDFSAPRTHLYRRFVAFANIFAASKNERKIGFMHDQSVLDDDYVRAAKKAEFKEICDFYIGNIADDDDIGKEPLFRGDFMQALDFIKKHKKRGDGTTGTWKASDEK